MSARLSITTGPDAGRQLVLANGATRIGTGATADFRLNDTALQGELLVELRNGAYHVTNRMTFAVYLDQQPLRPMESKVWYDGSMLQPTATTTLVLSHDLGETRASGGLAAVTQKGLGFWAVLVVAVIGVATGIVMLLNAWKDSPDTVKTLSAGAIERKAIAAQQDLQGLSSAAKRWDLEREWDQLRDQFGQARVADRRKDKPQAIESYNRVNAVVAVIRRKLATEKPTAAADRRPEAIQLLTSIEEIVNQRLIELAGK